MWMYVFDFSLPWILYNHMHMEKNVGKLCQIRLVAMYSLDSCRWLDGWRIKPSSVKTVVKDQAPKP